MSRSKKMEEKKLQEQEAKKLQEEKARNEETKAFYDTCTEKLEELWEEFEESHKDSPESEMMALEKEIKEQVPYDEKSVLEHLTSGPTRVMKRLHDGKISSLEEFYQENWGVALEENYPELAKKEEDDKDSSEKPSESEPKPETSPKKEEKKSEPTSDNKNIKEVELTFEGVTKKILIYLTEVAPGDFRWLTCGVDGRLFCKAEDASAIKVYDPSKIVYYEVKEFSDLASLGQRCTIYWDIADEFVPESYKHKAVEKKPKAKAEVSK